jgi:hypothetical protein
MLPWQRRPCLSQNHSSDHHHHYQQQQQQLRAYAAAKATGKQKGGAKGKGAAAPKKKPKARIEVKKMDEKDPLLQRVLTMLVPQDRSPPAEAPEALAANQAHAKAYSSRKMAEHKAWRAGMLDKLRLKQAALAALPPALRLAAAQEDLEPFPLTRHALYETPPEGYRG